MKKEKSSSMEVLQVIVTEMDSHFLGGFSAGYKNTCGSKEGWVPSTFISSRDQRCKILSFTEK